MSPQISELEIMEYAKGYPCLYGMSGGMYSMSDRGLVALIKNGSSWYIANRKAGALTYFPEQPRFEFVIVLQKESFASQADLYSLDAKFTEWLKQKGFGEFYVEKGGGKEWYYVDCPQSYLELRVEFLRQQNLPILAILTNDPYPIRDLTTQEKELLEKEDTSIQKQKEVLQTETLYEKFCNVFLGNKVPRRIQTELWSAFSSITNQRDNSKYRGIVQWPTGCGKTIAILIKIVLAKEYSQKQKEIYRGLFVSPKNDIMDTISKNFSKLSDFGIAVYDGSHGKLSKLSIPTDKHCLIMASHSALLSENSGMKSLPRITHIHYDEVHRITGDEYFGLLKEMLTKWQTHFLTGTSATPKTASDNQRKKLAELFGDPLTLLHKCDVDEAVREGWIATPRFHVHILEKNDDWATVLEAFVKGCVDIVKKKAKGGKNIFYIETCIEDVKYALSYARNAYPEIKFYAAIDDERTDDKFLAASVNEIPHILFACQRYREGSDIPGLEITGKLMGDKTAAHTLIQISGRALRIDYPEKEGWCFIARPSEPGTTIDDVLESILLEILDYLGKENKTLEPKEVSAMIKRYFGDLKVEGSKCSIQETIERLQSAYARIEFSRKTPKERYSLIQAYNKELGLTSKAVYHEKREVHPRYISDPQSYFKDYWMSWYHFLGVDISWYPQTKSEFHEVLRKRGVTTWEQYRDSNFADLPANPGELYSDWTNPSAEFKVEEEIVW